MIMLVLMMFLVYGLFVKYQFCNSGRRHIFKVFDKALVRKIKCMRIFPIVVCNFLQPFNYISIVYFYRKFTPVIKAAGCKINGANNCAATICEQHFTMQFQELEFVYFNANICLLYTSPSPRDGLL